MGVLASGPPLRIGFVLWDWSSGVATRSPVCFDVLIADGHSKQVLPTLGWTDYSVLSDSAAIMRRARFANICNSCSFICATAAAIGGRSGGRSISTTSFGLPIA